MASIEFESGRDDGRTLFAEKHLCSVAAGTTVGDALTQAAKNTKSRTFVGKAVPVNSIMAMTLGQQEQLKAWLLKYKGTDVNPGKLPKSGESPKVISGITVFGCVIQKKKDGTYEARAGGALSLGFNKRTGSVATITHFHAHDWFPAPPAPKSFVLGQGATFKDTV